MGQALDKVKQNLNIGENPPANLEGDKIDPFADLQKAISLVQNSQARELLLSQAQALKADFDLKTAQAQEQIKKLQGQGGVTGGQVDERAKVKQEIVANAVVLLEKGVSPETVGQYLVGSSTSGIPINLGGGQQGLTITDVLAIMDRMEKKSGTPSELKEILTKLTEEVTAIKKGDGNKPPEPATHYVIQDGAVREYKGNAPIIINQPAAPPTVAGEPLEVVIEKNRHDEKMEELKGTREYHEKITEIAGDAFENIGKGLASQVMEGGAEEAGGEGSQLEYFICPEEGCGTKIPVTPETKAVTCPKCHGIFQRTIKPPKE